jgi:amino acid transporter
MAKRSRRKSKNEVKRYSGKNEDEWKDWGENFGKRMEQRGVEFGEEMRDLGERFGRRMEGRAKKKEPEYNGWWFGTFGWIGPIFRSIFGIVCIAILILIINFVNWPLQSGFFSDVSTFLYSNLHWLFAIFLFSGYNDFLAKRYHKVYWMISPVMVGICLVIVIWIFAWLVNMVNNYVHSNFIFFVTGILTSNLWLMFFLFVVFFYVIVFLQKSITKK